MVKLVFVFTVLYNSENVSASTNLRVVLDMFLVQFSSLIQLGANLQYTYSLACVFSESHLSSPKSLSADVKICPNIFMRTI